MAAQTTEYEDHRETYFYLDLTTEYLYKEISDQKEEENIVKEFQEYPILDQKLTSKTEKNSEEPNQIIGVRRSTRTKVQFKGEYVYSMAGKTYEKVISQLYKQGTLYPDEHLLFNLSVGEQPSFVSAIMTQLSLKVGLKTWV